MSIQPKIKCHAAKVVSRSLSTQFYAMSGTSGYVADPEHSCDCRQVYIPAMRDYIAQLNGVVAPDLSAGPFRLCVLCCGIDMTALACFSNRSLGRALRDSNKQRLADNAGDDAYAALVDDFDRRRAGLLTQWLPVGHI